MQRIYRQYLAGSGLFAIAEGLTRDGILSPSASDPGRNPHRHVTAWAKSAVRVILTNPRYTGRQVWNKQRKAECLIDVDDVALGHETKMRWNPATEWIYSDGIAHEPLIDERTFTNVQARIAAGAQRPDVQRKPRASKRNYTLSGLVFCGLCERRMVGSFNNGRNHYRCTYATEYADARRLAHPRSVYLREDDVIELIDPWLGRSFAPENVEATLRAMVDAQHTNLDEQRIRAFRDTIALADDKLGKYRAALEAGTDPALVQRWTAQVQAEKAVAETSVRDLTGRPTMTADEIRTIVDALSGIGAILRAADPADKIEIYRHVGLKLTYKPGPRVISAEAGPSGSCTKVCPRTELNHEYKIRLTADLMLE